MSTIVYLIRHADKDMMWSGADALRPLTDKGEEQARRLANQSELQEAAIIYASPYARTINTIKPLADKLGIEIKDIDAFREREIGEEDDETPIYLREQWRNFAFKWPGGESLYEVQLRSVRMLKKIIAEHQSKTIVIATHMATMGTILNYYDSSFNHEQYRHISSPDIWRLSFQGKELIMMDHIPLT